MRRYGEIWGDVPLGGQASAFPYPTVPEPTLPYPTVPEPTHPLGGQASLLLGGAYALANSYSTTLWEYFFGAADAQRIKQTSLAITSATSGLAVWGFAHARARAGGGKHYGEAMDACAYLGFGLAAADLLLLAKPETLEAIVRRAPTWEQLLARRQRATYFSVSSQLSRCLDCCGLGGSRGYRWQRPPLEVDADLPLEQVGA